MCSDDEKHNDQDGKENSDVEDDKALTPSVEAVPVIFNGILKKVIPYKHKLFDHNDIVWPPVQHPCSLHAISNNESLSDFVVLNTFPTIVKVISNEDFLGHVFVSHVMHHVHVFPITIVAYIERWHLVEKKSPA